MRQQQTSNRQHQAEQVIRDRLAGRDHPSQRDRLRICSVCAAPRDQKAPVCFHCGHVNARPETRHPMIWGSRCSSWSLEPNDGQQVTWIQRGDQTLWMSLRGLSTIQPARGGDSWASELERLGEAEKYCVHRDQVTLFFLDL